MSKQPSSPLETFPEALRSRERQLEPFEWYRTRRSDGPVRYDERRDCYDVFDYDTVTRVLSDHDAFSSDPGIDPDLTADSNLAETMLHEDPPGHARLRGVVEDFFTPDAVADLEPVVRGLAERFLDDAVDAGDGQLDLVEAFAYPLPVTVIAEILGVSPDDRDRFRRWSTSLVASPSDGDVPDRMEKRDVYAQLEAYFEDQLAQRRDDPGDDLLSRIAATEKLAARETLGLCYLLLIAGNVTTTNLIANAVWCLGERDLFEQLRGDRTALERAIEETLRFRSPVQAVQRWTAEAVTLGDVEIPPRSDVVAWIGSANRDPAAFEDADAFVPDRYPNPHVAFGHGVHSCLGSSLARLEARVALETLLDRFEAITPETRDLTPSGSATVYGPLSLPVRYELRS